MVSIYKKIENEIYEMHPDIVFTINDIEVVASYDTVRKSLNRLEYAKKLCKAMDGIYYKPEISEFSGEIIPPSIYEVSKAIARKNDWTILPSGLACLNMMGLSTQVPADYEYLSDGPNKTYQVFNTEVTFTHTTPKDIRGLSNITGIVVQSLKAVGKDNIQDSHLSIIRDRLTDEEMKTVFEESHSVTNWVREDIKKIVRTGGMYEKI